jgi:hypothetical protein
LWWPAILRPLTSIKFRCAECNTRVFRLLGVDENVCVDIHSADKCKRFSDAAECLNFHNDQTPLESHGIEYANAVTELTDIIQRRAECHPMPSTVKRADAIIWDDYFLSVAFLSAMRSKDPSTQVGACIVNSRNRIVGIGYNGFPKGCSDDVLPWARTADDELDTKYPVII